jgi:NodT family efflux transporter outer membrane factor (OMF) lipoprotein
VALAQQQRQRAQQVNALTLLVGQPLNEALPAQALQPQGDALAAVAEVPVGLPSVVLLERPDIRAAEQQLMAANAQIGAARAAFFPRISLTASFGSASSELSGLLRGGSWGWALAPQALLPLFDGGANRAGLESAQAGRELAVAQYERAIQSAFREVNDALMGRGALEEELRAQQALANAESERLRLSELRLREGVASQLEVLDAQRSLFAAQQALLQTRFALAQNRVDLYRATGGY